jgi:tetratricopeptide (TPR) repeat protein
VSFAQSQKVTLDTSETLFTVLASINTCGYDQDLNSSDPLRPQIRSEVARAIQASEEAKETTNQMCQLYRERQQPDPSRDLAQYVSLALYLNGPPLVPKVKESELPPDALALVGMVPLMQKFSETVALKEIWAQHRGSYAGLADRYHESLAKTLFDTEIYLKMPSAGYLGRQFTVYLDPMGAPGQINARNYGSDYYVVISPGTGTSLKMEQIRHTYLHYLLDPLALKHGMELTRLLPLLEAVKTAPMDENFKQDISLLVTECMVRAIEARTMGTKHMPEEQLKVIDEAAQQGFILTRYFYDAFATFEKDPAGLKNAYADLLNKIDVRGEVRRASQIQFAQQASPELLYLPKRNDEHLLLNAERRLGAGDAEGAQKLAQEALDENREDPGRALFILAQVATVNRDMQGARNYFERALQVAQEPKVVVWSHIYLGRIFDLQENREAALTHYRAALTAGNSLPEAKAAAERGLQQAYEPPRSPQ